MYQVGSTLRRANKVQRMPPFSEFMAHNWLWWVSNERSLKERCSQRGEGNQLNQGWRRFPKEGVKCWDKKDSVGIWLDLHSWNPFLVSSVRILTSPCPTFSNFPHTQIISLLFSVPINFVRELNYSLTIFDLQMWQFRGIQLISVMVSGWMSPIS